MRSKMVDTPEALGKRRTIFVEFEIAMLIEELEGKIEDLEADAKRNGRIFMAISAALCVVAVFQAACILHIKGLL